MLVSSALSFIRNTGAHAQKALVGEYLNFLKRALLLLRVHSSPFGLRELVSLLEYDSDLGIFAPVTFFFVIFCTYQSFCLVRVLHSLVRFVLLHFMFRICLAWCILICIPHKHVCPFLFSLLIGCFPSLPFFFSRPWSVKVTLNEQGRAPRGTCESKQQRTNHILIAKSVSIVGQRYVEWAPRFFLV